MFAKDHRSIEVLNAGLSSYSPIIYLKKLRWLIDQGYEFDEAVVYVDISDIQDEGFNYSYDAEGNLNPDFKRCDWSRMYEYEARGNPPKPAPPEPRSKRLKRWVSEHLPITSQIFVGLQKMSSDKKQFEPEPPSESDLPYKIIRGMWTYNKDRVS